MHHRALWLGLVAALVVGCQDETGGREETGLEGLALTEVQPRIIVPGSTLHVTGRSFLDKPLGVSWLRMAGSYAGGALDTELPANFIDFEHMEVFIAPEVVPLFGPSTGKFSGQAAVIVDFTPDNTRHQSLPLPLDLELRASLEPKLDPIGSGGAIFVNDDIEISGDGFLLDELEGTTFAVVQGCFTRSGATDCVPVGPVEVPVRPVDPFDRTRATFAFAPSIAGILPGQFTGEVFLRNDHADGPVHESAVRQVGFDLIETRIDSVGPGGSLGQYIPIEGGGFVGGDDGGFTTLILEGQYVPEDAVGGTDVTLELVPTFVNGRLIRYIVNEEDTLGMAVDLRRDTGAFDGTIRPFIVWEDQQLEGPELPITFRLVPPKQVVYVKFNPTYVESLRMFGLRAMDKKIRERILAVMARDYESINVELRTEPPEDFELYATVEISGPDPNGLGLLGYDNTFKKDLNNDRLHDYIGGVNALTQQDGYPGFGGVFIESLFAFSQHRPKGIPGSEEITTPVFDQIFDPVRPDRGAPVSSSDFGGEGIPDLTSGNACPAKERRLQIACAVWVLGSIVGSTTSHELGHSMGLADPKGTRFHNLGDAENRLMDNGSSRPFEERAEIMGLGPSRFCTEEYEYLRQILPTDQPETTIERPHC